MAATPPIADDMAATSEAEQMYLITIAMAAEDGHEGPVPVPQLAQSLNVSRVSANEMVKKLAERGLVAYTPYKGAELTAAGESIARTVLRRRRLWAVFLAEHLGLSASAADAVACEFEHITPSEVAHQLARFLGDPLVGPGGKPIPAAQADTRALTAAQPLAGIAVGQVVEIAGLGGDAAARSFLEGQGIRPGARVTLLALSDEGDCLVETSHAHVHVSAALARAVSVTS